LAAARALRGSSSNLVMDDGGKVAARFLLELGNRWLPLAAFGVDWLH